MCACIPVHTCVYTCACSLAPSHAPPPKFSFQMTLQNVSQAQESSEHGSYDCSTQKSRRQPYGHTIRASCCLPWSVLCPGPPQSLPALLRPNASLARLLLPSAFQTYLTLSQHPDVGTGQLSGLLCIWRNETVEEGLRLELPLLESKTWALHLHPISS